MIPHRRRTPGRVAALATAAALALTGALGAPAAAAPDDPGPQLPEFEFAGQVIDKSEMEYNPTDEFIFPSIFHAGAHLDDPLGEWYLYYAPHDAPGGISLMYADSLDGPWTEYEANPIISNEWPPHYDHVSHVSSPDAVWDDATGQMLLYFHGENTTTRWASSDDGVTFDDSGVAVTAADTAPNAKEASYARVFPHPDPTSAYRWAMFYMDSRRVEDVRRIKMAESVDGKSWDVRPEPVVEPNAETGPNVSGANLLTWQGQHYVTYHGSSGVTYARQVDPTVTEIGPQQVLHRSSGVGQDVGRVAAPEFVTDGGQTYMFYESGDRLGATVAYATLERPTPPDPDPLRERLSGPGSDEFAGDALDPDLWRVVNPDGARHEVAGGALTIPTYPTGVADAAFPVQDVPDGAWEVTTQVEVDPREKYQQAGLILHAAGDTYAKLDHGYGSNGERLSFIWRQDGSERNGAADSTTVPASTGSVWLRLASDGAEVRASASLDGREFFPVGRPVPLAELAPTGIGLSALRGATSAPEITATFDWFRWTPEHGPGGATDAVPVS